MVKSTNTNKYPEDLTFLYLHLFISQYITHATEWVHEMFKDYF